MTVLINPGSGAVPPAGEGWTNTREGAEKRAAEWLDRMHADGLTDVSLTATGDLPDEGRWRFGFTHSVTGRTVWLDTHGIDDLTAYGQERLFAPRVYWNGSSCSDPELENWAAPGFVKLCTFRADTTEGDQ